MVMWGSLGIRVDCDVISSARMTSRAILIGSDHFLSFHTLTHHRIYTAASRLEAFRLRPNPEKIVGSVVVGSPMVFLALIQNGANEVRLVSRLMLST